MVIDTGWLKLHRKVLDSAVFQHPGMWHLFSYCLIRAAYVEKDILIPGTTDAITLKRGEFITGRNSLHAGLYPNGDKDAPASRTLWRWLESLQSLGCVTLRTVSNRCTLVSVCNYETYQSGDPGQCPADVPPVSSTCPADVPPVSTNKERNNNTYPSPGVNFEMLSPAIAGIEIDGQLVTYAEDWIRWEAEFIARWNALPRVTQHREMQLDTAERRLLHARFDEGDWHWKRAFPEFPLWSKEGWMPTLNWFLKHGSVNAIIAGNYSQREPKTKGKKHDRPLTNAGQVYDPNTARPGGIGW